MRADTLVGGGAIEWDSTGWSRLFCVHLNSGETTQRKVTVSALLRGGRWVYKCPETLCVS